MKKERIFWGLGSILAGIFLIISKLAYFSDVNVFTLLLTVFLLVVILKSIVQINFPGILFPIAFICIIYDKQLGITNITPWTVLIAATFVSIGLSMVFTRGNKWIHTRGNCENHKFQKINVEDESNINFKTSFGASIKYINTDNFENANLNCSFGAMKVYFDNATMQKSNAIVRLTVSFSGMELYVPKTWKVENKSNVFLGAIDEKNKNNAVTTNTLTLIGNVDFSGIEIIYI